MEFIYKLIFTVLLVLAIAAIAYIVEKLDIERILTQQERFLSERLWTW